MTEILPTVVPNSFDDIVRVVNASKSFADTLHIDVADGIFAPNTTWMPVPGDMLPPGLKYEIHLMVADPHNAGVAYAEAGASAIIGHSEAFDSPDAAKGAFDAWRAAGAHTVATAALLQTSLESLAPYVPLSDYVLLMTIASIGVQGIPFEKEGIERVRRLRTMHPNTMIAVDGGVSEKNIAELHAAGASRFCVGSALARSDDPASAYQQLLKLANGV